MTAETEVLSQLRAQLVDIIAGTFFLLVAAIALGIAVLRRRAGTKILATDRLEIQLTSKST